MNRKTLILGGFIVLKFVLQYALVGPEYELHRDEYLHLDQGNHLAWGFLSVPPVTSWISMIIKFLGNSVFWVRFFPALFGALTILVVWKSIEYLKGDLFALVLGAAGVLFSVLTRLNILFQPNSLDVLSWTAFYYILLRYLGSKNPRWLYGAAIVIALGFLNKYNVVFLLMGLVPAVLVTRERAVFLKKELYLAGLLALAIVTPNLWWQYRNDFPVARHLAELSEKQLVNVNRLDFLGSQLLFFIGSVFVLIAGLAGLLYKRRFEPYRLFFWSFFFTLALFVCFKAKDYYAIGLYPIYIAFGAVAFADFSSSGWKRWLRPVVLILPPVFFVPLFRVAFPNKSPAYIVTHQDRYRDWGLLRWEDGKDHELPQDFADMLGWKELAAKVDSVYRGLEDRGHTLVLCDNYGQAGAINFYTSERIRAVSFNADYINWFELDKPYVNLIRVKNRGGSETELAETAPYFEKAEIAGSVTNRYARESGTAIFSFAGARVNVNERIEQEIREKR